ncbi:NAD(P)-binding protein [Periconia macrospinosa]|uniref:NAD(P)-binding protein n=1 Tax=Periconia macrospinosa TaxID=97972 RepID=A0A2V1D8F3_9PLEO|nr:NAD(P)-binding protein [Periconia macrospinosa]
MSDQKTTLPKGSLILITGFTGFVASHTAKQFLERGYRVRGTVRNLAKSSELVEQNFKEWADRGELELVVVPDFTADHAFDEAIRGVDAVAHIAAAVDFDPNPNNVIPQTISSMVALLELAIKESSVKQFVYTSSIVAAVLPVPGVDTHVGPDTWNETAVELAWAPPPYEPTRGMIVYMASKVAAEKAMWDFVKERKPRFAVNSVSPAAILGEPLHRSQAEVKPAHVRALYQGDIEFQSGTRATISVNVKDVALLHVAAILDPDTQNERLQAWAQYCTWNDILSIMRKVVPDRKLIDDFPDMTTLTVTADFSQPLALLKKWGGQDGWISLEDTVTENVKVLVKMEF